MANSMRFVFKLSFGWIYCNAQPHNKLIDVETEDIQSWLLWHMAHLNTLRPRQNGRHFVEDTFKRIFMNENVRILTNISLKFVPKCLINNIPALVQIMAWRRPDDKALSEPMMVNLLTHICVTRPQWVKLMFPDLFGIGWLVIVTGVMEFVWFIYLRTNRLPHWYWRSHACNDIIETPQNTKNHGQYSYILRCATPILNLCNNFSPCMAFDSIGHCFVISIRKYNSGFSVSLVLVCYFPIYLTHLVVVHWIKRTWIRSFNSNNNNNHQKLKHHTIGTMAYWIFCTPLILHQMT